MKKIIFITIALLAFSSFAYAETITLGDITYSASSGVEGEYDTGTNDQSFTIMTWNTKGNKGYASTSEDTNIYWIAYDGETDPSGYGTGTAPEVGESVGVQSGWSIL